MKQTILLLLFLTGILTRLPAQETITQYLSGTDKDHTVPWEFFCTKGRNSGVWTTIPVPSLWDQHGFGNGAASDEQGLYRYSFPSLKEWQTKKTFIVFEGVLAHANVKLNGKPATDSYQSGFYQFSYDISALLRYDEPNLLEVTVTNPSNTSPDHKDGDPVGAGGIFAPVYLRIVPEAYVERVAIDAKANGNFTMQLISHNTKPDQLIEVQIQDLTGKIVGTPLQVNASDNAEIKKQLSIFRTWNPENPHLYQAVIAIKDASNNILHTTKQRFGFRTSELKEGDGFYVNGTKVIFKGVNRRPSESGIMVTREQHLADILTLKDMNMNAVRLSNYPPDPEFLDLCDSLGLFVINELSASAIAPDTAIGKKLMRDLVIRDVNHPSVVMWSNGNNSITSSQDSDYARFDLQQRYIIRPAARFGEVDTRKNADFNTVANSILYGTEVFYPSEFSHGVYNGGHAAGLDDFWTEMLKSPKFSGGFLWSFKDEGIAANQLDTARVAPDPTGKYKGEKGASYYAIREIWSPITFDIKEINTSFNGVLNIENRFAYTNLNKCSFVWKLMLYPKATERRLNPLTLGEGTVAAPYVGPGEKAQLKLSLPPNLNNADALVLTAYDAKGREINTWSWSTHRPADVVKTIPEVASISTIMTVEDENFMSIIVDGINYIFSKKNGNLSKVYCGKRDIPFIGPVLAGVESNLTEFKHYEKDRIHFIEAAYRGDNWLWVKWTFQSGELPKMEYQYSIKPPVDYMGITFGYPEEKIVGLKWMGRGPFQAWKNRLKGLQLGVWEKTKGAGGGPLTEPFKNNEVKGWHSDLYWVQFQTNMGSFTIYTEQQNIYLQFFKPQRAANALTEFPNPPFPENGAIGFMHSISGIGTKFQTPDITTAPARSSKSSAPGDEPMNGTLWIDFRH